jgi:O-antigen ligase
MNGLVDRASTLDVRNKRLVYLFFSFFVCLNIFPILKLSKNYPDVIINTASFLFLVILLVIVSFISYRKKLFSRKGVLMLIGSCALMLALATYAAVNTATVEFSLINYLTVPITIVIFLAILGNTKLSKEDFLSFNSMVIAYTLVACIYNFIINYKNILVIKSITSSYEYSFSSFYDNRNTFGLLLAISLALALYSWGAAKSKLAKFIYIIAGFIFAFSLFLTQSRGAILFFFLFAIVYYLLREGMRGLLKAAIAIVSLIAITTTILGTSYVSDNLIRENSGSSGRDQLSAYGLEIYSSSNILFGAGFGKPTQKLIEKYELSHFHSNYITILVTGGIIQAIFYISLLLYIVSNALMLKYYDKKLYSFVAAFMLGYLVYGTIETVMPFQLYSNNYLVSALVMYMPIYILNSYKAPAISLESTREMAMSLNNIAIISPKYNTKSYLGVCPSTVSKKAGMI